MTSIPSCAVPSPEAEADARFQPFALQVLGLIFYAGFAIVATVLAFVHFWPAGIVLALFIAWRGFGPPRPHAADAIDRVIGAVMPGTESVAQRPTGNASFDAYRQDMLNRLEQEQKSFEDFLTRLRDAKDQREFDRFMDDRATRDSDSPPA